MASEAVAPVVSSHYPRTECETLSPVRAASSHLWAAPTFVGREGGSVGWGCGLAVPTRLLGDGRQAGL